MGPRRSLRRTEGQNALGKPALAPYTSLSGSGHALSGTKACGKMPTGRYVPSGCKGLAMPLSEDEQRILHQIEQQFYESDPAFAQSVSQSTLYRHAFRRIKWSALMLVFGLVFLVFTLHIHFALAFVGFLIMLAAAFIIEKNARAMGRAGLEQMTRSFRAGRLRETFGGAGERMRNRFKRED